LKAYLIITGTIFGLMAGLHLWHGLAERHRLATDPGYFLGMAALGLVAAGLSAWAWCLLRARAKS
jgi:hypothetical protein